MSNLTDFFNRRQEQIADNKEFSQDNWTTQCQLHSGYESLNLFASLHVHALKKFSYVIVYITKPCIYLIRATFWLPFLAWCWFYPFSAWRRPYFDFQFLKKDCFEFSAFDCCITMFDQRIIKTCVFHLAGVPFVGLSKKKKLLSQLI